MCEFAKQPLTKVYNSKNGEVQLTRVALSCDFLQIENQNLGRFPIPPGRVSLVFFLEVLSRVLLLAQSVRVLTSPEEFAPEEIDLVSVNLPDRQVRPGESRHTLEHNRE